MFREFCFPLRCAALADWIQNSLFLLMTALMLVFRGAARSEAGVPVANQLLHPESAIECAILNCLAHMLG
jgi:hypothetical protein